MSNFRKFTFSITLLSGMFYSGMADAVEALADRTMSDYDEILGVETKYEGDLSYKEAMKVLEPKVSALKKLHNIMNKLTATYKQARTYQLIFDEHRHVVELLKENTRLNVMALEPFFENAAILWGAPQHLGGPGHAKYTAVGENLTQNELDEGKLEEWHYFTKYVHAILEDEIKDLKDETLLGLDMYKDLEDPDYVEKPLDTGYVDAYDYLEQQPGEVEAMGVGDYVEGVDTLVTVTISDDTPEDLEQETADGVETISDLKTDPNGTEITIALGEDGKTPKVSLKEMESTESGDAFEELYAQWNIARQILKGLYAGQKTWENAALGVKSRSAFPHWRDQRQQFYLDWVRYFTNIQQCYLNGQGGTIPLDYYKQGWPLMPTITDEIFQYYTKVVGGKLLRDDTYLNTVYSTFQTKFNKEYSKITGDSPPNCQKEFDDNPPRMTAPLPPWREMVFFGYGLIHDANPKDGIPDFKRLFSGSDEWMRINDTEKDLWQHWLTNAPVDGSVAAAGYDENSDLTKAIYYRQLATAYHELGYFLNGRERLMSARSPGSGGNVIGIAFEPTYNSKADRWNYGSQYKQYKKGNKNPLAYTSNRITDWFEIVSQEDDLRETRGEARTALLLMQEELYNDILEVTKEINEAFDDTSAGIDMHQVLQSSGKLESDYYTVYSTNEGGTKAPYGPGQGICEIEEYQIGFDKSNPGVNVDSNGCYRYWLFNDVAHDVLFDKLKSIKDKMLSTIDNGYSVPVAINDFVAKYPTETADVDHPVHKLISGFTGTRKSGNHWDVVGYNDWLDVVEKDDTAILYVSDATGFLHNSGHPIMWPWDKKEYTDQVHGVPDSNSFIEIQDYLDQTIAENQMVEVNFQTNKASFYDSIIPSLTHRGPKTYTRIINVKGYKNAEIVPTGQKFGSTPSFAIMGLDFAVTPTKNCICKDIPICSMVDFHITPDGSQGCKPSDLVKFEAMEDNSSTSMYPFPFTNTHFVKETSGDFQYRPVDKMTYQGVVVAPSQSVNELTATLYPLRERLSVLPNGYLISPCDKRRADKNTPQWYTSNNKAKQKALGVTCNLNYVSPGPINFSSETGSGTTINAVTVDGRNENCCQGKGWYGTVSGRLGVAPNLILADYNARQMALDVAEALRAKFKKEKTQ